MKNRITENTNQTPSSLEEFWGPPISVYTRAQAISDGTLVDLTTATDDHGVNLCQNAGFLLPVAITRAAWAETVECGGEWKSEGDGDVLHLPGGQSVTGRLWDLLWMLRYAIKSTSRKSLEPVDRVHFSVRVDTHGNGRHKTVRLWSLCGPGDDAKPVITVMLEGED